MGKQQNLFHDPATYRRMSEPFDDADQANKALLAFYDEVYESRKRHKITDVHIVAQISVATTNSAGEADEFTAQSSMHIGDRNKSDGMLAWAMGFEEAERLARAGEMKANGRRRVGKDREDG